MNGDWATARSLSEQGLTVWRAGNFVLGVSSAIAASAAILAQLGDPEDALARAREAERLLEPDNARGDISTSTGPPATLSVDGIPAVSEDNIEKIRTKLAWMPASAPFKLTVLRAGKILELTGTSQ